VVVEEEAGSDAGIEAEEGEGGGGNDERKRGEDLKRKDIYVSSCREGGAWNSRGRDGLFF